MAKLKHPRSFLFYGRSGTGKTTLACSLPKPLLLVDINDEGTDSVSDVEGVYVIQPKSWEELDDLYWSLLEDPSQYASIVIDTITEAQQMVVEEIGEKKGGSKVPGEWGTLTKQDWGNVASRLKEWITRMKKLPMEVAFIAQERVFNLDDDEALIDDQIEPEIGPRVSPSVADHLCAAVSVIGNTFIGEKVKTVKKGTRKTQVRKKEYRLRLGPNSYYITKIRKPKDIEVPDFVVDPTYKSIIEISQGE